MKPTLSTPKKYTLIRWPGALHEGKRSIGGGVSVSNSYGITTLFIWAFPKFHTKVLAFVF